MIENLPPLRSNPLGIADERRLLVPAQLQNSPIETNSSLPRIRSKLSQRNSS
jgi:hypothetical protein